jgi:cytochrome c biogenesis protein CcmG, thiol:disulfide interchange protein DsbE
VAGLAVVLALQVSDDERQTQPRSELLGKAAPAVALESLDGQPLRLEDLAGKSVIVNFWNSWCIPCKQEEPELIEFQSRHAADADFAMIGIVRDDTETAARQHAEQRGYDWTITFDPGDRAALDFGTRGQPETFAISPDGVIVGYQIGPTTVEGLEAMLNTARGLE